LDHNNTWKFGVGRRSNTYGEEGSFIGRKECDEIFKETGFDVAQSTEVESKKGAP